MTNISRGCCFFLLASPALCSDSDQKHRAKPHDEPRGECKENSQIAARTQNSSKTPPTTQHFRHRSRPLYIADINIIHITGTVSSRWIFWYSISSVGYSPPPGDNNLRIAFFVLWVIYWKGVLDSPIEVECVCARQIVSPFQKLTHSADPEPVIR